MINRIGIKGLLALSQNVNQSESNLNGSLVSLGDFREVRNFSTNAKSISIEIQDEKDTHRIEFFDENKSCIDIKSC